jgi:methyl-accepting chemotaxis protein
MSQSNDGSTMPAAAQQRAWWGDLGVRTKTLAAVAVTALVASSSDSWPDGARRCS